MLGANRPATRTWLRNIRQTLNRRRLRRLPLFPTFVMAGMVLMAVTAPWLSSYPPNIAELRDQLKPPMSVAGDGGTYWLGTDAFGRDVFSRLAYGSRVSLAVAIAGTVAAGTLGVALGLVAAIMRGPIEAAVMRTVDLSLAVPSLLIALALAVAVGPSFLNVILIIVLIYWSRFARQVFGEALSILARDYVAAARVAGAGMFYIGTRHVLPNLLHSIAVIASLIAGQLVLLESTLSFLGVGIPPPTASWGNMVSDGKNFLETAPWISFSPGIALLLLVLAMNLFGDWVRDHLDPRLRQVLL